MAFNIRCSYYLLELSQRCCSAQPVENKKGFQWQSAGQRRACGSPSGGSDGQSLSARVAGLCHPSGRLPFHLALPARLSLTNAFLICLTGNWITTRSAALRMGRSGLCVTWKCCKYSSYLLLVVGAQYLGSANVAAYLQAAAWCQDALVKRCLKIIHCDVL